MILSIMEVPQENKLQVSNKFPNICNEQLYKEKMFSDVTLVTNDEKCIESHRIILSSQSSFFHRILSMNPKKDLLIYLSNINNEQLQCFLEYIYLGNTEVEEKYLCNFLDIGKQLGVQGFEQDTLTNTDIKNESLIENIKEFGHEGDFFCINKPKLKRQNNGKFACDQCKFEAVTRYDIKRHKNGVHLGLKYKCTECTIEYANEDQIKAHIDFVHNGNFNICNICEMKFEQPRNLKTHIKRIHEGLVIKCKECDKTFRNSSAMNYHVQKEHRDVTHACDQCKYSTKVRKNLKYHKERKHVGDSIQLNYHEF